MYTFYVDATYVPSGTLYCQEKFRASIFFRHQLLKSSDSGVLEQKLNALKLDITRIVLIAIPCLYTASLVIACNTSSTYIHVGHTVLGMPTIILSNIVTDIINRDMGRADN